MKRYNNVGKGKEQQYTIGKDSEKIHTTVFSQLDILKNARYIYWNKKV